MDLIPLATFLEVNYGIEKTDISAQELLETIFIVRNGAEAIDIEDKEEPFSNLLRSCRSTLLKNLHNDNVLVYGYQLTNHGAVLNESSTHSTNQNTTFLNNHLWRSLHSEVGSKILKDILINHSGFQKIGRGFNHIFGDSLENLRFKKKGHDGVFFSLNRALYRDGRSLKKINPIPNSKIKFLHQVFKEDYANCQKPQKVIKRLHLFSKICPKIINAHQQVRYNQIAHQICREASEKKDNLERSLLKSEVMKFTTVCFEKVFPKETYGSNKNKAIIFSHMSSLIFGEKALCISLVDVTKRLKVKEIPWLGVSNCRLSKQQHEMRSKLLLSFITWLFQSYLPNLLASFFHITHISSSRELLFFHHITWRKITKPFIEDYTNTFLSKSNGTVSISQTETMKSFYCILRVMPKKNNEFRVINVPIKGSLNIDITEHLEKVNKEIRPFKRVLDYVRLSKPSTFPKLPSVNQIPLKLFEFKSMLLSNHGRMPPLLLMKFDLKTCYDNISKDQVNKALKELIKPEDLYFYYTQNELDLRSLTKTQSKRVVSINDIGTRKRIKRNTLLNEGRKRVNPIMGRELFDLTKSQIDHSHTKLGASHFVRKKGIFQGLHLSSLFCDIVLDRLIELEFKVLEGSETIILRIADDFLLISTRETAIKKAQRIIREKFQDYGVAINNSKTFMNFDSSQGERSTNEDVTFCGLNISTSDLSVYKQFDTLYFPLVRSHVQAVKKLVKIFKQRVSYNNLNTPLNSIFYRIEHVKSLAQNLAKSYVKCTKSLNIDSSSFKWFINELVRTLEPLVPPSDIYYHKLSILLNFINILSTKRTKYKEYIEFLYQKYNKLKQ